MKSLKMQAELMVETVENLYQIEEDLITNSSFDVMQGKHQITFTRKTNKQSSVLFFCAEVEYGLGITSYVINTYVTYQIAMLLSDFNKFSSVYLLF